MVSNSSIRRSYFSGPFSFYTGDPKRLSSEINRYLSNAKKSEFPRIPVGLISPHAGYTYSGQTAGWAYKQIEKINYERIIVFAPSHRGMFPGVSLFPGTAYETPLGQVPLDKDFCESLRGEKNFVKYDSFAEENEHSLEVQIPFLQVVQKNFKLVPLLISNQSYTNCEKLCEIIISSLEQFPEKTLLVASSDLYHGPGSDVCDEVDERLISSLLRFNPKEFSKKVEDEEIMACGYGPITTVLLISKKLGAKEISILNHTNSVESANGSEDYVVGYLAACVF